MIRINPFKQDSMINRLIHAKRSGDDPNVYASQLKDPEKRILEYELEFLTGEFMEVINSLKKEPPKDINEK